MYSYELDYEIFLPASDKSTYSNGKSEVKNLNSGGRLWQKIDKIDGQRIFVDGVNTKLNCYFIPASELDKFTNGQSFSYYKDYSGESDLDITR